ncbi:hypothetical protein, partial [Escherichia coli]
SLKTSIKTITYLSDIGCLEIQGASLLRLTVNTVITECAPLIQYTAEPFSQSGFLDSVAFFSTMHAVSPVTVCSSSA